MAGLVSAGTETSPLGWQLNLEPNLEPNLESNFEPNLGPQHMETQC